MSGASVIRLTIRLKYLLPMPARTAISLGDFASPDSSMVNQRCPLHPARNPTLRRTDTMLA